MAAPTRDRSRVRLKRRRPARDGGVSWAWVILRTRSGAGLRQVGDSLDLDQQMRMRKLVNGDRRPRGTVGVEKFGVPVVAPAKVVHIDEERADFDDIRQSAADLA